ncbi:rhomboid family intramembrane serine protease [Halobacillus kuroshimensis]|uniref:Rhomboid family intramembrane serine protease n=1 Tax=Halobacillus kuroshimensis TaxID=302481 RepID=A0ABS3DZ61_9BACI|nr:MULTISPECIES: rhomboid family intramembrane serine protease [Halobacillus]MBN8236631.1 rhomboid family intramembrane serine protease [Halobacillus kuroshimensis]
MFIEQEYYLWKMADYMVQVHHFQVLHVNTSHGEIWLEKKVNKKNHVFRLSHKQLNWRNELARELETGYRQLNQNRSLFRGGKLEFHMVFVSEHPPVDEWEDTVKDYKGRKIPLHLYYMNDENKEQALADLFQPLDIDKPVIDRSMGAEEMEASLPYMKHQLVKKQREQREAAASIFDYGRPRLTYVLLAVNILVFLYLEMIGSTTSVETLISYGAKYNPAIMDGEWWRIFTSTFLHIGFIHLFMNMLALYYLGSAVERIYGTVRFAVIYFAAGLFGGMASFMMNPSVAAGASGAIFGLFGALLFFGVQYKQLFLRTMGYNLIVIIGINIAFGVMVPQVDNGAHIGGLIGGFTASAMVHMPAHSMKKWQPAAALLYIGAMAAMVYLGITGVFNGEQARVVVEEVSELNEQQSYGEVIQRTTQALEDPQGYEAQLLFHRSFAYLQSGESSEAKDDLEQVISIAPDLAEAHYNLALLLQQDGELEKAAERASTAAELNPDNTNFQQLNKELAQ